MHVRDCFEQAKKADEKGRKHKGLLLTKPSQERALAYLAKAKINLELCSLYKEKGYDYKIPEEWFYTLYYCALAILAKCGISSRSQRCTALFLAYLQKEGIIAWPFIDRITVHTEKEEMSDVDRREVSRYGTTIHSEEIKQQYIEMMTLCREAIDACEEILFSELYVNDLLFTISKQFVHYS